MNVQCKNKTEEMVGKSRVERKMSALIWWKSQSVSLVMSTTPGIHEKPGNTSVSHNLNIFFCFCNNTKCWCVFDHKLQQHNKSAIGRGMKKDAEERLHLSDSAHTFFCVISQETRLGCQNQVRREKLKGVSFQKLQTRTFFINSYFCYVVYFSKAHTHRHTHTDRGVCN